MLEGGKVHFGQSAVSVRVRVYNSDARKPVRTSSEAEFFQFHRARVAHGNRHNSAASRNINANFPVQFAAYFSNGRQKLTIHKGVFVVIRY